MRRVLHHQSELSLATALFCLAWSLLGFFTYAWRVAIGLEPTAGPLLNGIVALLAWAGLLAWGAAVPPAVAAATTLGFATLVLVSAAVTEEHVRLIAVAFFLVPIAVYLMWFFPRWVARLLSVLWYLLYAAASLLAFGLGFVPALAVLGVSFIAVAELVRLSRDRLHTLVLTDALCPIWNRRGFIRIAEAAIAHARRTGGTLSILFADLDGFKAVNDLRGHAEGDRVLVEFARQLERYSRADEAVGRLGGDEFAVLMPGATATGAMRAGLRLRERITVSRWSFGVAELSDGETVNSFISRADDLMRADKDRRRAGRATAVEPIRVAGASHRASEVGSRREGDDTRR